ncbi:hypothetical protein ACQJBY_052671 [Aegilops geniculata]
MKDMIALQLLPCVLFLTVLLASSATGHAAASQLRLDLTDSGRGFTKHQLLHRMAARSRARVDSRWSPPGRGANGHAVTVPAARGTVGKEDFNSEYLIHFGIGTPRPQHVALTLDTGSDLIWTQCFCQVCFPQPFPELDASASGTAHGVSCFDPLCAQGGFSLSGCAIGDNSCFYTDSYGDNSVTTGKLYEDTFTFQQAPNGKAAVVPNLRFGCGMFNTGIFGSNESGIAGFGRGALSLPSQLKVGRFSHCFTTIAESRPSPVWHAGQPRSAFHGAHPIHAVGAKPRIQSLLPFAQGHHRGQDAAAVRRVGVRAQGGRLRRDDHRLRVGRDEHPGGRASEPRGGVRVAGAAACQQKQHRRARWLAVLHRLAEEEGDRDAEADPPPGGRGVGASTGELRDVHRGGRAVRERQDNHRQLPAAEYAHRLRPGAQYAGVRARALRQAVILIRQRVYCALLHVRTYDMYWSHMFIGTKNA